MVKNSEKQVSKQCTTQAQYTTADQQDAEWCQNCERESSHVDMFARELHGVTIGKSHVSLPWCVRFAAQIISRSHRGTDGMTGYRRAHGRSRMPRRYVPWSEKVFYLEQSK